MAAVRMMKLPAWLLVAGMAVVTSPNLAIAQSVDAASTAIDDLPNPPELHSVDGVLRGTLTVAPAEITVRGRKIVSNVINGNYMAPTLRVRRGDVSG